MRRRILPLLTTAFYVAALYAPYAQAQGTTAPDAGAPVTASGAAPAAPAPEAPVAAKTADPAKVAATKAAMRDLWVGHIFWIRNVVQAKIAHNKAAEEAAEKQVVADAHAIAATIEPFYGAAAKDKLFALLANHYGAVKAYLYASVAKDKAKQREANEQGVKALDELSVFLSTANPNLPKNVLDDVLQKHASHHAMQIKQLLSKDYDGEGKTWADMSQHVYAIADTLVDAIAKQFPDKF